MDEKRQAQKELFEEFVKADRKRHPKGIFQPRPRRTITLSYEHLIFIVMAFIITAVLFFSLGVERGKHLKDEGPALTYKENRQVPIQISIPEPVQKEPFADKETPRAHPQESTVPEKKGSSVAYTVQVASYTRKDSAEREAQRLEKKGFKPLVLSSGNYYIVCVGEFEDKTKATPLKKRLRELYPDCYVRKK